jgi:hypothetical protein
MISDDKYLHEKFKHFASLSLNKQRIIYIHILLNFGQVRHFCCIPETKTGTINFQTEAKTQMEVVDTIMDETGHMFPRL